MNDIDTVADLVAELLKLPQDYMIVRQMTAELGEIEIEDVRVEHDKHRVVID